MKNIFKPIISILLLLIFTSSLFAKTKDDIKNSAWLNTILMKGVNQRGGPFAFDDTYLEVEFGGRYEWLQLYRYFKYK